MSLPPPPNLAVDMDKCLYLPRQLLVDGPTNQPTLKAISRPASARAAGKNDTGASIEDVHAEVGMIKKQT